METNYEKDFYNCGAFSPLETSKDTTAEEDSGSISNLDDSEQMAAVSSSTAKLTCNLFCSLMLESSNFDEYLSQNSSID